jgi:hypothetical protein
MRGHMANEYRWVENAKTAAGTKAFLDMAQA